MSVVNAQIHRCYSNGVTILGEGHDWSDVSTSLLLSRSQKLPSTVYLIAIIHLFTPHSNVNACYALVLCWALAKQRWTEDYIRRVSQWAARLNFCPGLTSSPVLSNYRSSFLMTHSHSQGLVKDAGLEAKKFIDSILFSRMCVFSTLRVEELCACVLEVAIYMAPKFRSYCFRQQFLKPASSDLPIYCFTVF